MNRTAGMTCNHAIFLNANIKISYFCPLKPNEKRFEFRVHDDYFFIWKCEKWSHWNVDFVDDNVNIVASFGIKTNSNQNLLRPFRIDNYFQEKTCIVFIFDETNSEQTKHSTYRSMRLCLRNLIGFVLFLLQPHTIRQ